MADTPVHDSGKPYRTPAKNKSEPAPHTATDGHADWEIDVDTPEDNGLEDTRAAANQPRVSPVDGPVIPGPQGSKTSAR